MSDNESYADLIVFEMTKEFILTQDGGRDAVRTPLVQGALIASVSRTEVVLEVSPIPTFIVLLLLKSEGTYDVETQLTHRARLGNDISQNTRNARVGRRRRPVSSPSTSPFII